MEKTEDAKLGISELLSIVQVKLNTPKGKTNEFGGYKYRNCEDILEALKPLIGEYGFTSTCQHEPVVIGDWHYIKATETITLDGESLSATAYAREQAQKKGSDASQVTGATNSYARKYALCDLYAIDGADDPDSYDAVTPETVKRSLWNAIKDYAAMFGHDPNELASALNRATTEIPQPDMAASDLKFEEVCE